MQRVKSNTTSIDVLAKNLSKKQQQLKLNEKLMSSMTNDEFESPSASPASNQIKSDMSKLLAPSSPSSLSSTSSISSSSSSTSQIAAAMQALLQQQQQSPSNLAAAMQAASVLGAKELAKLNLQDSTNLLAANLLQFQQAHQAQQSVQQQQQQRISKPHQDKKRGKDMQIKSSLSSCSEENIKQEAEDEYTDEMDNENNSSMLDDYHEDEDLNEEDDDVDNEDRNRNNSTSSPTRSSSSQDQSRSISPSTVFNDSTTGAYPNLSSLTADSAAMLAGLNYTPGQTTSSALLAAGAAAAAAAAAGAASQTPGDLNSLSLISDAAAALITNSNAALPTPANSVANLIASTRKRRTDREQASERVKKIKPVPDDKKDEAYWERRRKNNEAAKRSRDLRRQKEDEIAVRASFLEQENLKLKAQVTILKAELSKLHFMLYNR